MRSARRVPSALVQQNSVSLTLPNRHLDQTVLSANPYILATHNNQYPTLGMHSKNATPIQDALTDAYIDIAIGNAISQIRRLTPTPIDIAFRNVTQINGVQE